MKAAIFSASLFITMLTTSILLLLMSCFEISTRDAARCPLSVIEPNLKPFAVSVENSAENATVISPLERSILGIVISPGTAYFVAAA